MPISFSWTISNPGPGPVVTPIEPAALAAQDRLIQQYKDATTPGVKEVVTEVGTEVQVLIDAFATFDLTLPPTVTGINLDRLGDLIGEPRLGRSDTRYLPWILAKMRANRSNGNIEDIIAVFSALIGNSIQGQIKVEEFYPASLLVRLFTPLTPIADFASQLGVLLRLTKKAGVGAGVVYLMTDSADTFSFDGGTDGLGWGDSTNPATGGQLAGFSTGD